MEIMAPYNSAKKLEEHFGEFLIEDFLNLVETFQVAGSEKNIHKASEFFKTLPKQEVIDRSYKIARLAKALMILKINKKR